MKGFGWVSIRSWSTLRLRPYRDSYISGIKTGIMSAPSPISPNVLLKARAVREKASRPNDRAQPPDSAAVISRIYLAIIEQGSSRKKLYKISLNGHSFETRASQG